MTARPAVLRQELVDRLRNLARREADAAHLPGRALGKVARPLRRAVVRLVDSSLQATLKEVRRATAAQPDIEVLRAELATTHRTLLELGRRLDELERRTGP